MRITTTKAHPEAKGRPVTKSFEISGVGAGASGGGRLPEDTDTVSIQAHAADGVDKSTSTRVFVTFGLDDRPNDLDALIGKLTDLRAKQRELALAEPRVGWESPPCKHFAGGGRK